MRDYRPERPEPEDFDDFWSRTLDEAKAFDVAAGFRRHDLPLTGVDVHDATFAGWGGHPVNAWFITPAGAGERLPCVVEYVGYNTGRGFPHHHLVWPAAGYAVLVVDARGQGGRSFDSPGGTADPGGGTFAEAPGMMTRGILDPEHYYYRRVFTDAVRAVDAAAAHPAVDPERIVVSGGSQGGAIAQAVAGLRGDVRAALIDVPFLSHFRRAVEITGADPYREIVRFLSAQRGMEERVFRTLSYFDGLNFAARGRVPALYSVALMDDVCPPSTVFAAYNHWAGPKEIVVYPWNNHEGGSGAQVERQLHYLRELFAAG
ncbi:cephalosporin-C deacetylase [Sinosporangium siamense]|uniref:Cephalosporin-C deacetylase n=1 Tax=Sinosporangium siamense TaxID=1367973 RepID=A0A919RGL2_9ACTN|nr:cephalosporin-C deacetylase [Sinosporangium siamense]